MFYYVGHGSQRNLGDEHYFSTDDIAGLANGDERFLFLAFSCDVGVFDSLTLRSMAERFVAAGSGGAIAALGASEVSYVSSTTPFSDAFFANLYPGRHVAPGGPGGHGPDRGQGLMGPCQPQLPALQPVRRPGDPTAQRRRRPRLRRGSLDTLRTGRLHQAVADAGRTRRARPTT